MRAVVGIGSLLRRSAACIVSGVALVGLASCGGAGDPADAARATPLSAAMAEASATVTLPASYRDAARFLAHATMGPTQADVNRLNAIGYEPWIDEQLAMTPARVRSYVETSLAAKGSIGQGDVMDGIWSGMLSDKAQLRQRVAFAWSEIFVISLVDGGVHDEPRSAASYYDLLAEQGLGNFRSLLQAVALHPMMGKYLSHLGNRKADPTTGRVPDENFAREVMQLFTIGLHQLNVDGTPRLGADGKTIDTYGAADVAGLAKVFTGWSWSCPTLSEGCFVGSSSRNTGDPDSDIKPMMAYPNHHSIDEKNFLGVRIAPQTTASPAASLKVALDTLFNHPNTAPFVSRLLIQRLVSSNPSSQYVADVAAKFANNGAGTRGDMAAVVRAILMHPEARTLSKTSGKVREPILRLTGFVRAFPYSSISGRYRMGGMEDPAVQIAQAPLRAPSVFNFFRPGFAGPGSAAAAQGRVAPEMQLVDETSVAGFVNYMRWSIERGDVGASDASGRRDVTMSFAKELELASDATALVDRVKKVLLQTVMSSSFRTELIGIIGRMPIPALAADGSNQAAVDAAKRKRVNAALLLVVASPEFLVQK